MSNPNAGVRTLAVCALFRNEARYLDEWVRFHHAMGAQHFFLYDNNSDDDPRSVLAPFIDAGGVTLIPWPTPFHEGAQKKAYSDCLERTRGRFRWIAFIDIDEFLFSPTGRSLPAVLQSFAAHPGVVVHWQCYGSNGQQAAGDAPVTERFTRRAPTGWVRNRKVKSIVDPARAIEVRSVHHFGYLDGAQAVDETGLPVGFRSKSPFKRPLKRWYGRLWGPFRPLLWRLPIDPYTGTDIARPGVTSALLRINHYPVKSREEFRMKLQLQQESRRYEDMDYFTFHDRNEVHDPILVDFGARFGRL